DVGEPERSVDLGFRVGGNPILPEVEEALLVEAKTAVTGESAKGDRVRAGPREAQKRGGELLRRHDPEVRRQAVEEADRDDVLLGRRDVGNLGKITVGLRELGGGARGRD